MQDVGEPQKAYYFDTGYTFASSQFKVLSENGYLKASLPVFADEEKKKFNSATPFILETASGIFCGNSACRKWLPCLSYWLEAIEKPLPRAANSLKVKAVGWGKIRQKVP